MKIKIELAIESFERRYGINCTEDEEKADDMLEQSVKQGNGFALAIKYFHSNNKIENKKSIKLFSEFLEKDQAFKLLETKYSLYYIARAHDQGIGVEMDPKKAFELYEKASNLSGLIFLR